MAADPNRTGRAQPGWRVESGGERRGSQPQPPRPNLWVRLALFGLILFGLNYWLASRATHQPTRVRIPYSPLFLQQVRDGNVATITTKGTAVQGELDHRIRYHGQRTRRFRTEIPAFANTDALSKLLQEKHVVINAQPLQTGTPWWQSLLFGFGPTLLFLALLFWLMRRAAGGAGGMLSAFGRSRARRYEPTAGRVTFADVAGIGGGHDEREQTLNQILTEMDGFDPSTGVIVLGATNRPDVLDPALLRPGRFDRRVTVQPPDRTGRRLILEVHTRGVPLAPNADLDRIAGSTPGMVGADLANLVNEAALLAARRDHEQVTSADFSDALEKIVLGAERKIMLSPRDRERTAYHEAGHAIVGMLTPGADPVRKVSIIPRGMALGVTFAAPEADRFSYDEHYLRTKIMVALGGRAADELVFGERTTGAEADIQQLTEIARQMVGRWGMSDAVGPIAVLPQDGRAPFLPGAAESAERTQELVDEEVRRIIDEAHEQVTELLRENRDKLDALAHALLEHETLDEDEAYAAAGVERPPADERAAAEAPAPA